MNAKKPQTPISAEDLEALENGLDMSDDEELNPREHPLESIAESLYYMERHMKAMVYMQHITMSEGNLTFLPEVFAGIYTGDELDFGIPQEEKKENENEPTEPEKPNTGTTDNTSKDGWN